MKKMMVLGWVILTFFITVTFPISLHTKDCYAQGAIPKISNLKISPNPAKHGEDIWIVFEFDDDDADVDKFFIENIWETKEGKIESKVHQYNLPSEIRDKSKGEIKKHWKVASKEHKYYRILKVWVRDAKDNQSNILTGELKLLRVETLQTKDLPLEHEAPVWNSGDKWTYKTSSGKTFSIEVIENRDDGFIVKQDGKKAIYDKKTLNVKFLIDNMGNKEKCDWRLRNKLNFPIFLNKKWTDKNSFLMRGRWWTFITEYKILGIEEVDTPAGFFKAYKIYCKDTNMDDPTCTGDAYFWYSPEVKNLVKQEFKSTVPHWGFEDAVIVRYKLK